MSKSNYLESAFLNHVLRNTVYTSPTTVYVGLSTADPGEDGSGLAEPVANGYSRVAATFGAPSAGACSTTNSLTFSASGGNWGTLTHFAIFDAATGGNILFSGALTTSRSVVDGDSVSFAAGALTVTEN